MKFTLAALILGIASTHGCDYKPGNDVTDHSKAAVDSYKLYEAVSSGDSEAAMTIYTTPGARSSKSPQDLATKDWAASGAPDDIYQAYVAVLGEDFLDSYNIDSINCSGNFEGLSSAMCQIAASKNAVCTTLSYALYEYAKAGGDAGEEVNWDEGFAFWYGLYDEEVDGVELGSNSPYGVQSSRDKNFGTSFKEEACNRNMRGQGADKATKIEEFEGMAASIAATFAQAALKYAAEMLDETDQDAIDTKWGEGYTYFRCGAGLMNPDVAKYIEQNFSPLRNDQPTDDTVLCGIATKMAETEDLGGFSMGDLNILEYEALADIESRCSITIPEATMVRASTSASPAHTIVAAVAATVVAAVALL